MANKINKIRVVLTNVRLSFANIFEPKGFNGGDPRYSASFLVSKQDEDNLLKVKEAIKNVIKAEWGNEAPKLKDTQICLRDGDNESWDGYADHFFISSGNKLKVAVRDLDGTDLTQHSEDNNPGDKPQSGDYVNAIVEIWAQNNNFGKRINANLVGVQYVKKGERFGKGSEDDLFAETTIKPKVVKQEEDPFKKVEPVVAKKGAFTLKRADNLTFTEAPKEVKNVVVEQDDDIDKLFD